jgi:hypothetical protein
MTRIEQRKHNRHPILSQPVGQFSLRTAEATYPIKVVKDISSSGIRVYLDRSLAVSVPVAVEYVEPGLKLEVSGTVAWCAARAGAADSVDAAGNFVIGVELLSPMLLLAALRDY